VARAFIVRPFGEKRFGKDQIAVNFDAVETALIDPALRDLAIEGRTTAEILESGNIRNDMFQRLLVSDLVIADLTVHNANVFYELGIRHALRDKRTFLIYSRIGDEQVPFDLQTDRYLAYDHMAPEKSLAELVAGLRRTLASDERDSPVFRLLPNLRSQDPGRFVVVPQDFRDELKQAQDSGVAGNLTLLAAEVTGLLWEREGLRLVGRALSQAGFPAAARDTWTRLLRLDQDDAEANLELGSICQALGEIERSNIALKRVLDQPAEPARQARAHALLARNAMQSWRRTVERAEPGSKETEALTSPRLEESWEQFRCAFEVDLREFGYGIEALARLTVWTALAERLADTWVDVNATKREAELRLDELRQRRARLAATVELALEIASTQRGAQGIDLRIARAQLALLTAERSERVRIAFAAAVEYASPFDLDALAQFLDGFAEIDVLTANVAAASAVVGARSNALPALPIAPARVLVYRGYGAELAGRESELKTWIRAAIETEIAAAGGPDRLAAIAGGACGGDIVFHESCQELKVASTLYLPFSPDSYVARFVQGADPGWVERFRRLRVVLPQRQLQAAVEMPRWLKDRDTYSFLERWNSWVLGVARGLARDVTLAAICDEDRLDDEGVADCVRKARQAGAKAVVAASAQIGPSAG
jgi:hypothetical protein